MEKTTITLEVLADDGFINNSFINNYLTGDCFADDEIVKVSVKNVKTEPFTRSISITWDTDDVLQLRDDLTEEEAYAVLLDAYENHDACNGINWQDLQVRANTLFPKECGK